MNTTDEVTTDYEATTALMNLVTVDPTLQQLLASIAYVQSVFSVLMMITGVFTVFANLLLFYFFMRFDYLRCKTNSYIISLALFDLLCGVVMFNTGVINQFLSGKAWVREFCIMTIWVQPISFLGSVLAMGGAAVEHYVHIVYPYAHARYAYSALHPIMAASIWALATVLASVAAYPEIDWKVGIQCLAGTTLNTRKYAVTIVPAILAALVAIAICLVKILMVLRRHRRQIAEEVRMQIAATVRRSDAGARVFSISVDGARPSTRDASITDGTVGTVDITTGGRRRGWVDDQPAEVDSGNVDRGEGSSPNVNVMSNAEHEQMADQSKTILAEGRKKNAIIVTLVSVTLVCWTPLMITILLRYLMPRHILATTGFFVWGEVTRFLMTSNSLINPLLYQRFSPGVKKAYHTVFGLGTTTVEPLG